MEILWLYAKGVFDHQLYCATDLHGDLQGGFHARKERFRKTTYQTRHRQHSSVGLKAQQDACN